MPHELDRIAGKLIHRKFMSIYSKSGREPDRFFFKVTALLLFVSNSSVQFRIKMFYFYFVNFSVLQPARQNREIVGFNARLKLSLS